jgi:aflatoxin B1 aldehyde reductase
MYQDRYWLDDDFAAVEELRSIAAGGGQNPGGTGVSVAAFATRAVDSIILGASRLEQLQENLKAAEGPRLDKSVLERCDAVWKRLRGITPKYNR